MAKYAYAPLSIDESRRKAQQDDDELVHERMPMCVGICILLAIVYVLSRTGDPDVMNKSAVRSHVPNVPPAPNTIPESTQSISEPTDIVQKDNLVTDSQTKSKNSEQLPKIAPTNVATTTDTEFTKAECDCPTETEGDLLAKLRQKALENTPPDIIECAKAEAGKSQSACHLSSRDRFAAIGQKGATLWMTGCSGSGKTTIATALEEKLIKQYGKHVYRLDGDNLRIGLNRDLGFSSADRAESVRRAGELATLFSDSGVITLVGLISPYRADRDAVRKRHEDQGIPFYEVFIDVPVEELEKRDPKGLIKKAKSGEIKDFTCISPTAPYEHPLQPEITLTHEIPLDESVNILFHRLERDGILIGAPKVAPPGLPNPDGDEIIDLHVPDHLRKSRSEEAATLPKVLITDVDLNWLQTIGEGWAAPLRGFMREGTLLETLHFNSMLVDPFNMTGNVDRLVSKTNFTHFPEHPATSRVSMPIPITLSCTSYTKGAIERSNKDAVALTTQMGKTVAILRNPEVYANRKEEIIARMYGVIDPGHPYIKYINSGGDYLIGGEIELLDRIRYNDGLDDWRKTVSELWEEFRRKGADTIYAFQTRNPTHAGHAYLMRSAGENLKAKGFKKPVLWLSPLGGWTKPDDVPLDVRVKQHVQVLEAGMTHPGGLDPETTVMGIWPAPMVYAGPTEVQFHAKSRRCAGASYFVVGRDPAGMTGSMEAIAHKDDDLYDPDHGRYVLQNSPGIGDMKMLSFMKVMYDTTDNVMKIPDESRKGDFIGISGTKMRLLARNGAVPCSPTNIPKDLEEANCIPSGFMVPKGWNLVVDYYKHAGDAERWIPWSKPRVEAPSHSRTKVDGQFGSTSFRLKSKDYESWWHDVPMRPPGKDDNIINLITEIPMYVTAKMEVQKEAAHNVISQDRNKDGSPRHYTYGTPFFNYGLIPQTWEDPNTKSSSGHGGDNDPIDVMEIGSKPLLMGSITPCRVIGSLELIDEGETDQKIICISLDDEDASSIHSMDDLERIKPGTLAKLIDWLKRYKTSDGKGENELASETPRDVAGALKVIGETHDRWRSLCGKDGTSLASLSSKAQSFWLKSPGCRGD